MVQPGMPGMPQPGMMIPGMMGMGAMSNRPNMPMSLGPALNPKKQRELYVGNVPTGAVSEPMLKELEKLLRLYKMERVAIHF